jgi:hypothetical protein
MFTTTLALVEFSLLRWCLEDKSRVDTFVVFLEWNNNAPMIHYIKMFLFGILPFQLLILVKEGFIDTFRKTASINRHVCDVIIVVNLQILIYFVFIRIIPLQQYILAGRNVPQSMQALDFYYSVLLLQNVLGLVVPMYKFKTHQSVAISSNVDIKKKQ